MKEVQQGDYIQVEYTGMVPLTKGKYAGKDAHTVAVDIVELDEGQEDDGL